MLCLSRTMLHVSLYSTAITESAVLKGAEGKEALWDGYRFCISPLVYLHLHGTDHAANAVALGT